MKVKNREEAWIEVNKLFPTDYEKDYASSNRAGYDIYRHATLNPYNHICDLGNRLEVLTGEYGENVTNIWIEEDIQDTEILGVQAKQIDENTYIISLTNGKIVTVIKDAILRDKDAYGKDRTNTWDYKVDTQYFSKFDYARKYLHELITEKLTGNRIIYHARRAVPCICGSEKFLREHAGDSWGCRAQTGGRFSNLCSDCPIAEEIQAERDSVKLIYACK